MAGIKVRIKNIIRFIFNKMGYSIMKKDINDLNLYYKLFGEDAVKNKRFFNIGAGPFVHPAWTNVDHYSYWYSSQKNNIDIDFDLMKLQQIPVKKDSAFIIYTSHTIEHITDKPAQNMFNEAYRILKKGGCFRITAPNADLAYRAFKENDIYFYNLQNKYHTKREMQRMKLLKSQNKPFIGEWFLWRVASSVSPLHTDGAEKRFTDKELKKIFSDMGYEEALNFITSHCPIEVQKRCPGNHVNWWNFHKLKKMLKKAGFVKIYLSGYGQSFSPVLRNTFFFDNTAPELSLYVEAFK